MKKILIAFAALSLTACNPAKIADVFSNAPAPLAQTGADEQKFIIALETFDTLLTSIDKLVARGIIKPGSPTAIKLADYIRATKLAYQGASAAQRAGNTTSYETALGQARLSIANINLLIKGL